MNRSCVILVVWFLVLASGCGTREFKEYTSKEGRFSILLPAGQQEENVPNKDKPIGTLLLAQPNGSYWVVYQEVPELGWETPEQMEHRLDESRESVARDLKGNEGTLHGEKKVTLAGRYPGREIVFELPKREEWARGRLYLAEGRLYHVFASGKKWWLDSRDAEKVIDSFRVLPREGADPPG